MSEPVELLTAQFLAWIAARPRCYADVMDAWHTSCPRLPVWEAAIEQGLVQIDYQPRTTMADCPVVLTEAGHVARSLAPA
ncbi:MAG TPA: hypothetical protein VK726_11735 [Acetobacteraceae bacterium]|jgi:hypothetical protein|nr:hypothetical protein [Acetobacteraceae bacterium]